MELSLKVILKSIILFIWNWFEKLMSLLTTLIIIAALVLSVLFLMKIKPYVVKTGSMEPAIPIKSICFVNENIPFETIQVGEVIAFRMGETLVTHRVTEMNDGAYITKGDANKTEDLAAVTSENYIGKTIFVIPKIGFLLIYLHSPKGKIVAVTLIILLFILSFFPKDENRT